MRSRERLYQDGRPWRIWMQGKFKLQFIEIEPSFPSYEQVSWFLTLGTAPSKTSLALESKFSPICTWKESRKERQVKGWLLVTIHCQQESSVWGVVQKEALFSAKQLNVTQHSSENSKTVREPWGQASLQLHSFALFLSGLLCSALGWSTLHWASLFCSALFTASLLRPELVCSALGRYFGCFNSARETQPLLEKESVLSKPEVS